MLYGSLEITFASGETRTVRLEKKQVIIGRDPATDVPVEDNLVSRQHAVLLCDEQGVRLVDVGSSNGTFLGNDRLAARQPVPVSDGVQFRVGKTVIRFVAPQPESASPPEQEAAQRSAPETTPAESKADEAALFDTAQRPPMTMLPGEPPPPPENGAGLETPEGPRFWSAAHEEGRSTYLRYLPSIFSTDDFMARFLLIFESILGPIDRQIDHLHWYFDPHLAPPDFLPWLASWLGLVLSETWPDEQRRALVRQAVELYQWRGTRHGLSEFIRLYTGCPPEILEPGVTGGAVDPALAYRFIVRLHVPDPNEVDMATLKAIIEAEKPAHAAYTLEVLAG